MRYQLGCLGRLLVGSSSAARTERCELDMVVDADRDERLGIDACLDVDDAAASDTPPAESGRARDGTVDDDVALLLRIVQRNETAVDGRANRSFSPHQGKLRAINPELTKGKKIPRRYVSSHRTSDL